MNNTQNISLSVLRIAIGWHFLYEGLLKVLDPDWSGADFLSNATGPFASFFHGIAQNPGMLGFTDFLNQWGLVLIGLGLMLGFLSRWACLGGMLLLLLYYFANPPFIGLNGSAYTEGNYLIVNKNLVEFFALWVLFLVPAGRIYGLDRLRVIESSRETKRE